MAETPILPIEVFVTGDDGTDVSHGMVDFMPAFAEMAARHPVAFSNKLNRDDGIFIRDVIGVLPKAVHEEAWKGRLALPGLKTALTTTLDRIGLKGFVEAHRVHEEARQLRYRLERAEEELALVRTARWEPDDEGFGMLFSNAIGSNEGYIGEDGDLPGEMVTAAWDAFERVEKRPDTGYGSPEVEAWNARLAEWTRREFPPYVFGTTEHHWGGVTLEMIRGYMDDHSQELRIPGGEGQATDPVQAAPEEDEDPREAFAPDAAVEAILDNEMSDLFEDAIDHVKDQDGLYGLVGEWARTGDDAALEKGLKAWNAGQNLVSYSQDRTVILPVYPDATHEEAIAYCEGTVAHIKAELATVMESYSPLVVAAAEAEVAAAPSL